MRYIHSAIIMSLPVWEEWIEIVSGDNGASSIRSLPVWEEWIEIHGLDQCVHGYSVSSRMGRVD